MKITCKKYHDFNFCGYTLEFYEGKEYEFYIVQNNYIVKHSIIKFGYDRQGEKVFDEAEFKQYFNYVKYNRKQKLNKLYVS